MKNKAFLLCLLLAATPAVAQQPPAQPPPFSVLGGQASLSVSNSSTRVALPASVVAYGAVTLYNKGAVDAFVALGGSSVSAAASGGCTVAGGPGPACLVPAGTYLTMWVGSGTYVAGITASGSTTLVVYQGSGPLQFGSLNAPGGAAPIGAAGGDLSGTYPNPSVASYNGGTLFGSAAAASTGTSGATVPLLNGNNTWSGTVIMSTLPAADPHVAGQLWNNAGVLQVSAG